MLIQDAYILGMRLHKELHDRKIIYAKTAEHHDRIWKESIEAVKKLVDENNIDLVDPLAAKAGLSFNYYSPQDTELRRV